MTSDSGYTLAEMLAAMFMIALAIGGLTQGVRVMSQMQTRTAEHLAQGRAMRASQAALDSLVRDQSSLTSAGRLTGTSDEFDFTCDDGASCRARLTVLKDGAVLRINGPGATQVLALPRSIRGARFVYRDGRGEQAVWPTGTAGSSLSGIELRATRPEGVLAAVRIWDEQPRACEFDAVARRCRESGL